MKTRTKWFLSTLACIAAAVSLFAGCAQEQDNSAAVEAQKAALEAQKMSQRAQDMLEVQNVMGRHAYYHSVGLHYEELADIWVSGDGEFAGTATFKNMAGIWEGMPLITKFYAELNLTNRRKDLEAVATVYPEIKNDPNYELGGGSYIIHTLTTPIVEIAGDGKTAKGVWYSPGISTNALVQNGKVETTGGWFWEKYGVDFVKENGEWKIWHIGMYYDNTPPGWGATREQMVQTGEQESTMAAIPPTRPNPEPYAAWTPTTIYDKIEPRLPEPYETFSETFSY